MDLETFKTSLAEADPPATLAVPLKALWWEAKGDWHKAHHLAQKDSGAEAAWVHAYLHRVEGDNSNARYWYRRAERPESPTTTAEEWAEIAAALLSAVSD